MEKLNTNFPDLIFYNLDFNRNFTLTKEDLFSFNIKDKTDNNLYFLIVNGIDDENRWMIGIPFLKKYVLSFDYDNKRIGYYKNYGKENYVKDNGKKEEKNKIYNTDAFKIVIIILSSGIIFILGMLFNNYLKKSRKKRANELDDIFEYDAHEDQSNKIINDS